MPQTDGSAALPPSSQPSPTDAPTITPTHYSKRRLRASTVDIDGKEEGHGDVDLIWEKEQQRIKEREAIQGKFATLFEPPTPRASPAVAPSPLPPVVPLFDHHKQATLGHRSSRTFRPSYSGSGFGSFVGATEDPLSFVPAPDKPREGTPTRGDATPSAANTVTPSLTTEFDVESFQNRPFASRQSSNKTLEFFDFFTYEAKQRSSAARGQVLDELLLHEDDPMWFVFEASDGAGVANHDQADSPSLHSTSSADSSDEPSRDPDDAEKPTSPQSFLLDIDHDYFRPSHAPSSYTSPRSLSPIRHRMPSRSGSIPPPGIAPPVACPLNASPPIGQHLDSLADSGHIKPPITPVNEELQALNQAPTLSERSSSLSSLSSKLMSSLLRGTQASPPLSPSSKLADTHSTTLDRSEEHTSASTHRPVLSEDDSTPPRPLALSMSPHASRFSVSTRRIPFAPAVITHSTSPFAPSVYNSPSGAPGFKGDRYDWDKGFSDALESEWKGNLFAGSDGHHDSNGGDGSGGVSGSVASSSGMSGSLGSWGTGFGFGFRQGRDTPPKMGSGKTDWKDHDSGYNRYEDHLPSTSSTDTGSIGGMGDLIERKVGTIELVGRTSSDAVLMSEIASMLHAHLPALSRLPRSWRLIYSLDQHGVSLNTLYSRCEAHLSQRLARSDLGVSNGMLLAIKDGGAGEEEDRAIFGAWIAEGLKLNKGRGYSGGGESFLWKYADGIFKVFKATGKNNYVALCEPDYISFGGGDGHYGLYLDDTLFEGSSAPCPTFDNEPLCSGRVLGNLRTVKFECLGLEVWGMA